jgi:hypothetical protein
MSHEVREGDPEKPGVLEIERTASESGDSNDARIAEFSPAEQKKIIHRVDRRLVATLGLLYMASLMDRTNLAAANIAGYAAYILELWRLLIILQYEKGS